MNGMAASDKIFRFLELPEAPKKAAEFPKNAEIVCENLRFSYEADREILKGIDLRIPRETFVAIAGRADAEVNGGIHFNGQEPRIQRNDPNR